MPDLSLSTEIALVVAAIAVVAGARWAYVRRRTVIEHHDAVLPFPSDTQGFDVAPSIEDRLLRVSPSTRRDAYANAERAARDDQRAYGTELGAREEVLDLLDQITSGGSTGLSVRVDEASGLSTLGSETRIVLESVSRAYLSLLQVDPEGAIDLLVPVRPGYALLCRADSTLLFPGTGYIRWYAQTAGPHSVFALATPRPIPQELLVRSEHEPEPFYRLDPTEALKLALRLRAIVSKLRRDQYAAARFDWEVREPATTSTMIVGSDSAARPAPGAPTGEFENIIEVGLSRSSKSGSQTRYISRARSPRVELSYDFTGKPPWPVVPDQDGLEISLDLMSIPEPKELH